MADYSKGNETAILVHIAVSTANTQENISEFQELALSAGVQSFFLMSVTLREPHAKYFIGTGKAQEIKQQKEYHNASLILINHPISATQERNLEQFCGCRIIDRTALILDIFAARAHTFEGKLQVELAQHQYLSTRLIRGWTHLERQKGGIGLRGPGETQLETDRRLIKGRIQTLKKRLEKVRIQRDQRRQSRQRNNLKTVSLVGYTNAGKSTLFNQLTHADVYTADKLFATLDPTLRRVRMLSGLTIIFADTVGFIRHLPHDLIAAFHSTLLETREASLLLHVIDVQHALMQDHINQVNTVLKEIHADHVSQIEVYNKIDLTAGMMPHTEAGFDQKPAKIWISAVKNKGLDNLKQAICDRLA